MEMPHVVTLACSLGQPALVGVSGGMMQHPLAGQRPKAHASHSGNGPLDGVASGASNQSYLVSCRGKMAADPGSTRPSLSGACLGDDGVGLRWTMPAITYVLEDAKSQRLVAFLKKDVDATFCLVSLQTHCGYIVRQTPNSTGTNETRQE